MHCTKCGSEVNPASNFCPHCGERTPSADAPTKQAKPLFTFVFLALVALIIIGVYFLLNKQDLDHVVTQELNALKEKHYTAAYYEYTSKNFQETTSLDDFKKFVKGNYTFGDNTAVKFVSSEVKDNVGVVQTILTAKDGTKESVLFHLVKEEEKWKIQFMQIDGGAVDETSTPVLSDNAEELLAPIEKQLSALQKNDLKNAYEGLVSTDFQKNTSFEQFSAFIQEHPILNSFTHFIPKKALTTDNDQAKVTIILNPDEEKTMLQYRLIHENGGWKIWGLQIVVPQAETADHTTNSPNVGVIHTNVFVENTQLRHNTANMVK